MVSVTCKFACLLERIHKCVEIMKICTLFFHQRVVFTVSNTHPHTHTVRRFCGSCLFHGLVTGGAFRIVSEQFCWEPLYNLATSTMSARLKLIFSVINADTKEYPCSCPVRWECCASFLFPSHSLLAVLLRGHFLIEMYNSVLWKLWIGQNVHRTQKERNYCPISWMDWINQIKQKEKWKPANKWN